MGTRTGGGAGLGFGLVRAWLVWGRERRGGREGETHYGGVKFICALFRGGGKGRRSEVRRDGRCASWCTVQRVQNSSLGDGMCVAEMAVMM